jgi:fumarylacetoacetase
MLRSFLPVAPESHFPLNNLPYGVFSTRGDPSPRPGVALGDSVVDLRTLSRAGLLRGPALAAAPGCFEAPTLNAFMGAGRAAWAEARAALLALLAAEGGDGALRENAALRAEAIVPQSKVTMHLPAAVGDFTDFYASLEHATNCGRLFGCVS